MKDIADEMPMSKVNAAAHHSVGRRSTAERDVRLDAGRSRKRSAAQ
jgi:hypothetical protein